VAGDAENVAVARPSARDWFKKLAGPSVSVREKLRAALWACLAIGLSGLLARPYVEGLGVAILLPSMGASAVILFAVPHSPMAKPWALWGGHLLSGCIGLACARGIPDVALAAALAAGSSIFVMHWLGCLHPPGGASALIPVLGGPAVQALGLQFLLTPLGLNVAVMFLASQAYLRLLPVRIAPAPPPADGGIHGPNPMERLGIRGEDLRAALRDIDEFIDVDERGLRELYNLAAARAFRREFGELTCARIMSKAPWSVEFGDELETVWATMQAHKIKALPVVDRGRHVLGIITLTDFFRHARVERHDGLKEKVRKLIRPTGMTHSDKPEVAGQIMSYPALTARADAHIGEVARLLTERGVHQAPIVDERGKLAGIVTQTDLIAALYRMIAAGQGLEDNA
jgi:CBS domain-containing membrane protein